MPFGHPHIRTIRSSNVGKLAPPSANDSRPEPVTRSKNRTDLRTFVGLPQGFGICSSMHPYTSHSKNICLAARSAAEEKNGEIDERLNFVEAVQAVHRKNPKFWKPFRIPRFGPRPCPQKLAKLCERVLGEYSEVLKPRSLCGSGGRSWSNLF
ncbi:hypothetical protein K474DRAFT_1664787 [Panus rudis PR-1116 ss-1]|nr:hypothetical protein K474DRAFT_1664787 [Panus rudis PR-1116 ss-1]